MYKYVLTLLLITFSTSGNCIVYHINNVVTNDTTFSCFEHIQRNANPFDTIFVETTGKLYKSFIINKPLYIIGSGMQMTKNTSLMNSATVESVVFGEGSQGSSIRNLNVKNEIIISDNQITVENCMINNIYINTTIKPLIEIFISNNTINSILKDQISISEIISKVSFPVSDLKIKNNQIISKTIYSIYFSKHIQGEIAKNTINGRIFSNGTIVTDNISDELAVTKR